MSHADAAEFLSLWPTPFLQRILPEVDSANKALHSLLLSLEKQQKVQHAQDDPTSNYLSQELMAVDDPVIDWFKSVVNASVVDYLRHQNFNYGVDWGIQAWSNINRRGDYHNLHNHPHSYLSGTYYVSVPSPESFDKSARADLNPGAISFFDPRAQANMLAIRGDAQVDSEHRVQPVTGMLLLWPSFLHHLVHPNLSDELRISVSFNIMLKWRDEYVP